MKDRTKIILGALAGAAAGVAVGVAISDKELLENVKGSLSEAGDKLALNLQDMVADGKDLLEGLKKNISKAEAHIIDLDSDIQAMEG